METKGFTNAQKAYDLDDGEEKKYRCPICDRWYHEEYDAYLCERDCDEAMWRKDRYGER